MHVTWCCWPHSGLSEPCSVTTSPSNGRLQYAGTPLAITQSVCNSGHGGMVVMSGATFTLVRCLHL